MRSIKPINTPQAMAIQRWAANRGEKAKPARPAIQIGAVKGPTIRISFDSGEGLHVIRMPEHYGALSAILHVVPLQLLAYHTACARGTDVDKPRNLAKSVTVE